MSGWEVGDERGWGGGVASLCQLPSCEAPRNKSDLISSKHFKTRLPISVLSLTRFGMALQTQSFIDECSCFV